MQKFTLKQIRFANSVIFPEDFKKAYLEHFGESWYGHFPGLFWFIDEYCHSNEMMELAENIVSSVVKGVWPNEEA